MKYLLFSFRTSFYWFFFSILLQWCIFHSIKSTFSSLSDLIVLYPSPLKKSTKCKNCFSFIWSWVHEICSLIFKVSWFFTNHTNVCWLDHCLTGKHSILAIIALCPRKSCLLSYYVQRLSFTLKSWESKVLGERKGLWYRISKIPPTEVGDGSVVTRD